MFTLNKGERFAAALALLVFFAWIVRDHNIGKDREWRYFTPSDPVTVNDSTELSDPLMSR